MLTGILVPVIRVLDYIVGGLLSLLGSISGCFKSRANAHYRSIGAAMAPLTFDFDCLLRQRTFTPERPYAKRSWLNAENDRAL